MISKWKVVAQLYCNSHIHATHTVYSSNEQYAYVCAKEYFKNKYPNSFPIIKTVERTF